MRAFFYLLAILSGLTLAEGGEARGFAHSAIGIVAEAQQSSPAEKAAETRAIFAPKPRLAKSEYPAEAVSALSLYAAPQTPVKRRDLARE